MFGETRLIHRSQYYGYLLWHQHNSETVEVYRTFLACLPEIGGRRLAIFKKQLATVSKRCNPKHTAEEKNRVCIAKQIPHVWLDQIGVFNTCYCSGMYVLSSLV